ncbi:hypothetical protein SXGG_00028 [Synechococcus phage S-CBP42]|uniref:Uncharacterized protein n=1 Tax=Synechococcus phage S-CBP42 TaxID=461711 RepID=G8EYE5_9CAUD|nr:hypothetical protein AVU76_gp40 [Synechococcus phage S-CBP42]AET72525.1 hypothetical protein SXGG_00028 [Synechococcus phage S-CBP42]AGK86691.1 hypothetical protein S-CBP42_0040 [Synechococcus phage S-CBP42]
MKNLLKGLTAAAVGLSCVALPVLAQRPNSVEAHKELISTVARVGYSIYTKADLCDEKPEMLGFLVVEDRAFVLCIQNVKDEETFKEVIRHEAVHVAQVCKGGPILPELVSHHVGLAQDRGWPILAYDPAKWPTEGEARVLGADLTAEDVTYLIRAYCRV